jgi:hypothetical protein
MLKLLSQVLQMITALGLGFQQCAHSLLGVAYAHSSSNDL